MRLANHAELDFDQISTFGSGHRMEACSSIRGGKASQIKWAAKKTRKTPKQLLLLTMEQSTMEPFPVVLLMNKIKSAVEIKLNTELNEYKNIREKNNVITRVNS